VFVGWPTAELSTIRREPERELLEVVDLVPDLAERVRSGQRVERLLGATQLPNFLRRPGGPGWALVGDAGCHKDPYSALGLCDAFRDAEFLVEAIGEILAGRRPEAEALAEYERRRNESTMPDYRKNLSEAELSPRRPDVLELRASVRGDQEATKRYFLVGEGLLPREALEAT
jgi:flavin-dependent dehydrogenase